MVISREDMILTDSDASTLYGVCDTIHGDASLCGLVRAIALRNNNYILCGDIKRANVLYYSTSSEHTLLVRAEESVSDIAIFIYPRMAEIIDIGDGWSNDIVFGGKKIPINQYLSQYGNTKVFINESEKRVLVIVGSPVSSKWVQAFESILFRLMPWYYPQGLSEDEKAFFKSISIDSKLSDDDKRKIIIKYVNDIANKSSIRDNYLHNMLDGIADSLRRDEISTEETILRNLRSGIRRCIDELSELYSEEKRASLKLSALQSSDAVNDDSIFKFFSQHKNVKPLEVDAGSLRFCVDDTLEFYDEEEYDRISKNRSSYLYEYTKKHRDTLNEIFIERKGVIRVSASFELKSLKLVRPLRDTHNVKKSMPNPHVYFFACSGGNEQYYTQYAESGDWDLGIEQAISATKNVNFGDRAVCRQMISWLIENKEVPCIYVNDDMSPVERVVPTMKLVSFEEFMSLTGCDKEGESDG